jgi:hypothetical protein
MQRWDRNSGGSRARREGSGTDRSDAGDRAAGNAGLLDFPQPLTLFAYLFSQLELR